MKRLFFGIFVFAFILSVNAYADEKQVNIACSPWQPYWGEELVDHGIFGEIVSAAYATKGLTVKAYVKPWARVLHEAEKGKLDAAACAYYSDQRAIDFLFSEPVMPTGSIVFYTKKGNEITWERLDDLKSYKIGILLGSSYSESFDKADFLNKETVRDEIFNLKKVLAKRIDLTPLDPLVANYLIDKHIPEEKHNLKIILPVLKEGQKTYLMFSKKTMGVKKKIQMLNEGLSEIKQNGTYQKILTKYGIQ